MPALNLNKWSEDEERFLLVSLKEGKTYEEIALALARLAMTSTNYSNRSVEGIARKIKRINKRPIQNAALAVKTETIEKVQTDTQIFDDKVKKLLQASTHIKDNYTFIPKASDKKILSLSDIHFPFANEEYLNQAISDHADADVVILNGDIIEGYAFSVYPKSKKVLAIHEYNLAFEFVKRLSEIFPKIVITDGNHEVRVSRALKESNLHSDTHDLFRPNIMARIANGEELDENGLLKKKHMFANVHYSLQESWYAQVGKTLFIHPSDFGSNPGGLVLRHYNRFKMRYSNQGDFDSIVCGHTHQIYKGIINNTLLIEQGCLASYLDYSWGPKAQFLYNAANGYAVIYQDSKGNTDFNNSGPIYLGQTFPPKKPIEL